MNRRTFLAMGAAATAGLVRAQSLAVKKRIKGGDANPFADIAPVSDPEFDAALKTIEETSMMDDERRIEALRVIQRAIDLMQPAPQFLDAMREASPKNKVKAALDKFPVMRWYERSFDRVLEEFKRTKPDGDKPAIWYLYNMGVIVKTKTCAFGIDICHRRAPELAPFLDFVLVTHNHGDHFNTGLLKKMTASESSRRRSRSRTSPSTAPPPTTTSTFRMPSPTSRSCAGMVPTPSPSSILVTAIAPTTSSRAASPTCFSDTAPSDSTS